MYLLYLDDSGSVPDKDQRYFVLAGVCLFERQGYFLFEKLDAIAARFNSSDPDSIELHGSPMLQGKDMWRSFPRTQRFEAMEDALKIITESDRRNRIFAVAVNKESLAGQDPVEFAFEQLCSRFDMYLKRLYRQNDPQRGLIILDKQKKEQKEHALQGLARTFRRVGHSWGVLANLAEVPVFLDSRASRLIQLADLIAYATFRNFERNDDRLFNIIQNRFDSEGGRVHGLVHKG